MAYTLTAAKTTVHGDQRVWHGVVSADATSGVVSFGLGTLTQVLWSAKSMATTGVRVRLNALPAGTASQGDVGFSGLVSGDDVYVTVYGR